jgi:hypothetical protein
MKHMGAALAGVGVFLVGHAVAAAPPAKADCPSDCYAAIAYSPSKALAHINLNNPTQAVADAAAVASCNAYVNVTDCVVVVRGTQCLALATIPSGPNEAYHGGAGPTRQDAQVAALADHPGWTIQIDDCNGV